MYFGMHFFNEIEIPNIKALKISLFQLKQLHNIIVSDLFLTSGCISKVTHKCQLTHCDFTYYVFLHGV